MAKIPIPDGWASIPKMKDMLTITVEEQELVLCKDCRKAQYYIERMERAIPHAEKGMIEVSVEAAKEIIGLLKEQEATTPSVGGSNEPDGHGSWWYQCGKCKMPIDHGDGFCRHCGRPVQWPG